MDKTLLRAAIKEHLLEVQEGPAPYGTPEQELFLDLAAARYIAHMQAKCDHRWARWVADSILGTAHYGPAFCGRCGKARE